MIKLIPTGITSYKKLLRKTLHKLSVEDTGNTLISNNLYLSILFWQSVNIHISTKVNYAPTRHSEATGN